VYNLTLVIFTLGSLISMRDRSLSRRERKKLETRQRLLEAALRLFQEQGYDDMTVEEIAEAADVAKGTFFNYFEAKELILPALAQWRFQQLEELLAAGSNLPDSPVARIKLALGLVAEDPLADPSLMRRLFAVQETDFDVHPAHALTNLLAGLVRQAQASGEIRPDLAAIHVGGMVRALFFHQLMSYHLGCRPASLSELLDQTVDLMLDGVAGPSWRQAS